MDTDRDEKYPASKGAKEGCISRKGSGDYFT
jgi:hypothetical protein